MRGGRGLGLWLPAALLAGMAASGGWQQEVVITRAFHHLGDDSTPEWSEAPEEPEGKELELRFTAPRRNRSEQTLRMRHRHVDERWVIVLNGEEIGELERGAELAIFHYPVPEGAVRKGENVLVVRGTGGGDDITIGEIVLLSESYRELFRIGTLQVHVRDAGGQGVPVRLTITGTDGALAPVHYGESAEVAIREGIVYTANGDAAFGLSEGSYTVYASRGMEWSAPRETIEVRYGRTVRSRLQIEHEVATPGYVAADTHIHTLTFSGHGDSSLEERVITLAGEGVELAIATDHNHQTDYLPAQEQAGLSSFYTAVTGNEVTTDLGHFNAFPLEPGGALPDHRIVDWVALMDDIRAAGARVIILNHPRWPAFETGPFGVHALDQASGERHDGPAYTFDAIELYNSTAPETHPDEILQDWFALLNAGERLAVVGSSDSHTVADMVGQGRTYVASSAVEAGAIDVEEVCAAFSAGRITACMGLYLELSDHEGQLVGRIVAASGALSMRARVAAASWATASSLTVVVNGAIALEREFPPSDGPTDLVLDLEVPLPAHDAWVVCTVRGPQVQEPFWYTSMPELAAPSNPIYVDADADGSWSSPRAIAAALLERTGGEHEALVAALAEVDAAVAVQAVSALRRGLLDEVERRLQAIVAHEGPHQEALRAFTDGLPRR